MGKRCVCERLLRRLEEDVRLRTLPMAAQFLWVKLMRLVAASDAPGVLHLGSDFGFLTAVSIAVSHAETETETALAPLIRRGLVEVDEDARTLRLPDAVEGARRVEAARSNGLRGGRPRKGETPEDALRRRQGSLAMPLRGGLAETQETEREPKDESSRAASSTFSEEEGKQAARAPEGWVSLGNDLAAMAGMDPARGPFNVMPVLGWLREGATPELLRDVFAAVVSRPSYQPGQVGSLQYFNRPVREAIAAARAEAAPVPPAADPLLREWQQVVAGWTDATRPPPSRKDFLASRRAAA